MKQYIILLLFLLLLLTGCVEKQETGELKQTSEEFKKESVTTTAKETVPLEGSIEFGGTSHSTLIAMDTPVDVDMEITGKLDYKIDEKGIMRGSGKGTADFSLKSDIGIAKCTGRDKIPIEFSVTGVYDKDSGEIAFLSHDTKPSNTVVILNCPSEYSGDLTYDLTLPILFFVGDRQKLSLEHKNGAIKDITINHPVADWDTEIVVDWNFKTLIKYDEFDFDIEVDPAIINVEQGEQVGASVTTVLVRGEAKNIALTVTSWPKINAFIVNPSVTPTEITTLTIETTCDTVPDTYLYTVQGETSGTFKTSADSVSVVVTKSPSC